MDKKLQSESFYVFHTKAKPFSVQHFLNFEILGGFGKLVHDINDFEISYVDLIKLWGGVNKNTNSKFEHLDLFFDDYIQAIANKAWDFIWANYIDIEDKLTSQNQHSSEDTDEIYLNVNNLENYHIFPTKQFIKKQSEFFESLKWRYHNPKQDLTVFENNNFVLSSSDFANQKFNNIQAIYVNQVNTNNLLVNFFDIEKFIFFGSENLKNFKVVFQKTEINNIVVFSIKTPLFLEDNFTPFFYYANDNKTSQKVAFFWFNKRLLHNEIIPRFVFMSDKDFDDFLMLTTSLGIDKITNRRFLNSAAGVMAQQTKTIVVDGENISENVLKGFCFTTTYSFLIEYICQLLKPEFKIIKDADDSTFELFDEYENPSVWGIGFLNNFSEDNKQTVDYPLNMTISETATCIWDVESNFIFDNAVKFDGVLLMGTGIPEIDISPFQNNPTILKSDFDINGEIETKKVLTANTTVEPSLFSVSVNFKRDSFFAFDKTEYEQLETVIVENLRFFIFDMETEDVLFISDKLDNVDKLYENTIFSFDCVFRFWSSWGETIEINDLINII